MPTIEPYTYQYALELPEFWPEPWRETHPDAVLVERHKLELIAKPARLHEIRANVEHLAHVEASILASGLLQPLRVTVDLRGKLTLHDGHHRLLIAGRIGMDLLPVEFHQGNRIRGWGREIHVVAADLLKSQEKSCQRRRLPVR